MESKGFSLHHIDRFGSTFYFIKGTSRKVRYIADYQNVEDESYFEIHEQDGWKLIFRSRGGISKWYIWFKEYEYQYPEIYTDSTDMKNHARKTLIMHSVAFLPILIIYLYMLILNLSFFISGKHHNYIGIIITFIIIVEFSILYAKIFAYYLRMKKKAKNLI